MHIIFPPTPQELLDNTDNPIDVFQATIGQLVVDVPIKATLLTQAWARFRNRCIGDWCVDYWIRCLQDRINVNWIWYSRTIGILVDDGILSLLESETYVNTSGYDENNGTSSYHFQGSDVLEHTDQPQTAPDGTKYISDKNADTTENFNEAHDSRNDTSSGTQTGNASSSMKIERLNRLMNQLKEANNKFFDELDPLFMNRL